jgi:hypothetical protein
MFERLITTLSSQAFASHKPQANERCNHPGLFDAARESGSLLTKPIVSTGETVPEQEWDDQERQRRKAKQHSCFLPPSARKRALPHFSIMTSCLAKRPYAAKQRLAEYHLSYPLPTFSRPGVVSTVFCKPSDRICSIRGHDLFEPRVSGLGINCTSIPNYSFCNSTCVISLESLRAARTER